MNECTTTRIVAIHAESKSDAKCIEGIVAKAVELSLGKVVLFFSSGLSLSNIPGEVPTVEFPSEVGTLPKQKNFIINWCKSQDFKGFLHIMESSVIANGSTKSYMDKLEATMSAIDYDVHFSTTTDKCNYVFNKFCPRLSLDVDDIELQQKLNLPSKICFTSHSNVAYITMNFGALNEAVPLFDERFTIGMFFIIEFLARRRATKREGQLYYMNQYLSIGDEVGGYDILDDDSSQPDADKMQQENELFKSIGIDYSPDNNIDIVLDALYRKLKTKL